MSSNSSIAIAAIPLSRPKWTVRAPRGIVTIGFVPAPGLGHLHRDGLTDSPPGTSFDIRSVIAFPKGPPAGMTSDQFEEENWRVEKWLTDSARDFIATTSTKSMTDDSMINRLKTNAQWKKAVKSVYTDVAVNWSWGEG